MNDSPLKILILSSFDGRDANVIRDFLFCFNAYSRHEYYYIFDCRTLNKETDFSYFDVILIFWDLYLPGSELPEEVFDKIYQSPALKVLFRQDEYRDVYVYGQMMNRLGVQIMFTCVAKEDHEIFYPRDLIPSLRATYTVLTGYVPPYLENKRFDLEMHRPIDIGYRSRALPYYLGDMGQEKSIIAERFKHISLEYGFGSDISVREQDRIYGNRWVRFLSKCRFVLGSSSGASVVDFNGAIRRNCDDYMMSHSNATYEEVKQRFFADVDWKVTIDTVSPRIFETAALGCTMVLHEGKYANIIQPGEHYICVKKDYSNITEVVDQMRDKEFCRHLTQNAYRHLVASDQYSYRTFVRRFDGILDEHFKRPFRRKLISRPGFYLKNFLKYGESIIPQRDQYYILPPGLLARDFRRLERGIAKLISIVTIPELRRLLFAYFYNQMWKIAPPDLLLMDLSRLGILYRWREKKLKTDSRFWIDVDFDLVSGKLIIKSHPVTTSCSSKPEDETGRLNNDASLSALFKSALSHGQVQVIEWDHSAVGSHIRYMYSKSKTVDVDMGIGGYYNFKGILNLLRHYPDRYWAPLMSILI